MEIHRKLTRAFKLHDVPEPIDVYVARWDQDPLYRGAYSFLPNQQDDSETILRDPVIRQGYGSIHFAGEAMHRLYKGYLQAAYLSGEEEADSIADYLA